MKTHLTIAALLSLLSATTVQAKAPSPLTGVWLQDVCGSLDDEKKVLSAKLYVIGVLDRTMVSEGQTYCIPEGETVAQSLEHLCEFVGDASQGTLDQPLATIIPAALSVHWGCD
jgi:hypothetical protein